MIQHEIISLYDMKSYIVKISFVEHDLQLKLKVSITWPLVLFFATVFQVTSL